MIMRFALVKLFFLFHKKVNAFTENNKADNVLKE